MSKLGISKIQAKNSKLKFENIKFKSPHDVK